MRPHTFLAVVAAPIALSAPAPIPDSLPEPRALIHGALTIGNLSSAIPALLTDPAGIMHISGAVAQAIAGGTISGTDVGEIMKKLFSAARPTAVPADISQAREWAAGIRGVYDPAASPKPPANIIANALNFIRSGFTTSDIQSVASGVNPYHAYDKNVNRAVPPGKTFYNNVKGNAPFSVHEEILRAAIYIPPGFTWGKKQPVLFSPGTGGYGFTQFDSNIGKLLATTDFADPVYLNVPHALLSDVQSNAEFVAYALQYLHALTSKSPAIVTWSQGSIDTQWAFKYWPSIPRITTDHIAISPDYHGTTLAYILCPGFRVTKDIPCAPAIIQQDYESNFIKTLRSNDGSSAYVPTTTVYSLTDEVVQPQEGRAASGFVDDVRGVGTSNVFLQHACPGLPAGGIYGHAGVMYNPVAYALVKDALLHDGPGSLDRVRDQCANFVAPGLTVLDVIDTEASIPESLLNTYLYPDKVNSEPEIRSYATY